MIHRGLKYRLLGQLYMVPGISIIQWLEQHSEMDEAWDEDPDD